MKKTLSPTAEDRLEYHEEGLLQSGPEQRRWFQAAFVFCMCPTVSKHRELFDFQHGVTFKDTVSVECEHSVAEIEGVGGEKEV